MGQGLDGLCVVDVVADADGTGQEVGVPVDASAVAALEPVAAGGHDPGELVPQPLRRLAAQELRPGGFGQGLPTGLGNVPDVGHPVPRDRPCGCGARLTVLAAVRDSVAVVGSWDLAPDGCEDLDAPLALVDLAAQRLPGLVAGNHGRVRACRGDEENVVEGVGVQARGDVQARLPVLAGTQGGDLLVQALVQGGQLLPSGRGGVMLGHGRSFQAGAFSGAGRRTWWARAGQRRAPSAVGMPQRP